MLLAGDIGATKTDLAVYSRESGARAPVSATRRHSADYDSPQNMIREFLSTLDVDAKVDYLSLSVAGPVINGRIKVTNLPWLLDESSLAKDLNIPKVHLMNDLEAVARAVPLLLPTDIRTLNEGVPVAHGTMAVIAPGTGLGESFLTWDGSGYVAHSSEGGHSNFGPQGERQIRLLEYLGRRFDHVSAERVCSGIGIPNIYEFLRDIEGMEEAPEIAARISSAKDRTQVIVDVGVNRPHESRLCRSTIDLFISILASEAGNLALKTLATGGLYLAGGLALHVLATMEDGLFMQEFIKKGRFRELMTLVPVRLIRTAAAIMGAAAYGLEAMEQLVHHSD